MSASRRGHGLSIVMFGMTVVLASISVFLARVSLLDASRRDDQRRQQAHVLARTACASGFTGKREDLVTRAGQAQVSSKPPGATGLGGETNASVEVQLADVTVQLDCASGALRYERRH